MKSPLNTKLLQTLCEAVVRDTTCFNESPNPKAQDDAWARLSYESLPQLQEFFAEQNAKPIYADNETHR